MATAEEVKKFTRTPTEVVSGLAALARISVAEEELPAFVKEFDAILTYVGQLESLAAPADAGSDVPPLRNVMRKDGEPHAGSKYTEKLAAQFPAGSSSAEATEDKEGVYLEVKQIITHE